MAAHARAKPSPPVKPKRSILEELLSRKTSEIARLDRDGKPPPKLPKIDIEKLFCTSDEIEIRLKTTKSVPISDDAVSSSSSTLGDSAEEKTKNLLKATKFQDLVESRIKFYCLSDLDDDGSKKMARGTEITTPVECDSTDDAAEATNGGLTEVTEA